MPSGKKPLPEPMLSQICVAIWCHWSTVIQAKNKETSELHLTDVLFGKAAWLVISLYKWPVLVKKILEKTFHDVLTGDDWSNQYCCLNAMNLTAMGPLPSWNHQLAMELPSWMIEFGPIKQCYTQKRHIIAHPSVQGMIYPPLQLY